MITLRLFRASDPFNEIESRALAGRELTIGRDPTAGWTIADTEGDLSRLHCSLGVDGERVFVRDLSANGIFIGPDHRRPPLHADCEIKPGETFFLGDYMILLDPGQPLQERIVGASVLELAPEPHKGATAPVTDAYLLEAFCRGAQLEPSSFAGEDTAQIFERLGAAYRQTVDDMCSLLNDRAMLKTVLQMERTTISARDNNMLKWAPPHRVAIDLLVDDNAGFLKGADAFEAAFTDLRRHGESMRAGSQAATRAILQTLDPDQIESCAKRNALGLGKADAAWKGFRQQHASLAGETGAAQIDRAFRAGYEAKLATLQAGGDEP